MHSSGALCLLSYCKKNKQIGTFTKLILAKGYVKYNPVKDTLTSKEYLRKYTESFKTTSLI
eukprot:snap_masked-scaffold_4-processed-gene-4.21-mRNA-1 protein AED:1.00 eAED:1.00 QI:0/0/0/0/1/1/2/0/60